MSKSVNVVVGIVLILLLVVYAIFLYISYREKIWIFAPYKVPPLQNGFQPNGQVKQLTPAEQARRRAQFTR